MDISSAQCSGLLSPATEHPATTDQLSHAAGPQQHPHPLTADFKLASPASAQLDLDRSTLFRAINSRPPARLPIYIFNDLTSVSEIKNTRRIKQHRRLLSDGPASSSTSNSHTVRRMSVDRRRASVFA